MTSQEVCLDCEGTGTHPYTGDPCGRCGGKIVDWLRPGEVNEVGKSRLLGSLPVRSKIKVETYNEPEPTKKGWTVNMSKYGPAVRWKCDETPVTSHLPPAGAKVLVQTLVGVLEMTIKLNEYGEPFAESEVTVAFLDWNEENGWWSSSSAASKIALEQLGNDCVKCQICNGEGGQARDCTGCGQ